MNEQLTLLKCDHLNQYYVMDDYRKETVVGICKDCGKEVESKGSIYVEGKAYRFDSADRTALKELTLEQNLSKVW